MTLPYAYDASGNLTAKSDYATDYDYEHSSKPNAVTSITKAGGGTATFTYDANGNRLTGDGKTLTYTAFNKPKTITAGGVTASFSYGADGMRYRQHKSNGETTLYLDKLMEIVTVGSTTDYRHYLSDVAILTKTGSLSDPSPAITFLHRDRLGSLATITSGSGSVQARGFDPFGKPRNGNATDRTPPTLDSTITERGFTEHEHLDESQLIHMNGRVYDYNLGRFLSVDPVIQAPGNSQSLNPYSYIMNNPLAGTDPSGYTPIFSCETAGSNDCGGLNDGETGTLTQTESYTDPGSRINKTRETTIGTITRAGDGYDVSIENGANLRFDASGISSVADADAIGSQSAQSAAGAPSFLNNAIAAAPQTLAGTVPMGDAGYELLVNGDVGAAAQSAGLEAGMTIAGASIGAAFGGVGAAPGAAVGYVGAKVVRWARGISRIFGKKRVEASRGSGLGGAFSHYRNSSGGRVYTSSGSINQADFADIVRDGVQRGDNVHILSGVHGAADGTVTRATSFLHHDIAAFGSMRGVTVHDVADLSTKQLQDILEGPGTVVGAFCDSGACLR